jgi:hypothetical protein
MKAAGKPKAKCHVAAPTKSETHRFVGHHSGHHFIDECILQVVLCNEGGWVEDLAAALRHEAR